MVQETGIANPHSPVMIVTKRMLGCSLALVVGWSVFVILVLALSPTCRHIVQNDGFTDGLQHALRLVNRGARAAGVVTLIANLLFIAICLFTPRSWPIWRWPMAAVGGIAGGLFAACAISVVLGRTLIPSPVVVVFTASVGGAACLSASVFSAQFIRQSPPKEQPDHAFSVSDQ
jgi:hypothetical protein